MRTLIVRVHSLFFIEIKHKKQIMLGISFKSVELNVASNMNM